MSPTDIYTIILINNYHEDLTDLSYVTGVMNYITVLIKMTILPLAIHRGHLITCHQNSMCISDRVIIVCVMNRSDHLTLSRYVILRRCSKTHLELCLVYARYCSVLTRFTDADNGATPTHMSAATSSDSFLISIGYSDGVIVCFKSTKDRECTQDTVPDLKGSTILHLAQHSGHVLVYCREGTYRIDRTMGNRVDEVQKQLPIELDYDYFPQNQDEINSCKSYRPILSSSGLDGFAILDHNGVLKLTPPSHEYIIEGVEDYSEITTSTRNTEGVLQKVMSMLIKCIDGRLLIFIHDSTQVTIKEYDRLSHKDINFSCCYRAPEHPKMMKSAYKN